MNEAASRRPRTLALLLTLAVTVSLVGCDSVRSLRAAQDDFNRAAEAERTGQAFTAATDGTSPAPPDPAAGYRLALATLEGIQDEQSLERDDLYVTKRTLEAMCHWKLGDGATARTIAAATLPLADAERHPRDRAILLALPGLVMNDQAYAKLHDDDADVDPDEVADLLFGDGGAASHIDRALAAATDRPIEVFLLQARLALYRNLQTARPDGLTPTEVAAVKGALDELGEAMERAGAPPGQADTVLNRWALVLGVSR